MRVVNPAPTHRSSCTTHNAARAFGVRAVGGWALERTHGAAAECRQQLARHATSFGDGREACPSTESRSAPDNGRSQTAAKLKPQQQQARIRESAGCLPGLEDEVRKRGPMFTPRFPDNTTDWSGVKTTFTTRIFHLERRNAGRPSARAPTAVYRHPAVDLMTRSVAPGLRKMLLLKLPQGLSRLASLHRSTRATDSTPLPPG